MTDVLATTRCPQCVALVRPGQPWCTLCHADLRPEPEPVASEPTPPQAPAAPLPDPLTDPLTRPAAEALADPGATPRPSGKHARHAADASGDQEGPLSTAGLTSAGGPSEAEIEAMLAQLSLQTGAPLGGAASRFDSRAAKVALAAGVGLGAMILLLLGAFLVEAVFG